MMAPDNDADSLEVPKNPSGGKGHTRAAGVPRPHPSGPARDLRSARLGIKRALRDRRAGRLGAKEFERIVNAHKALVKIALRALDAQREREGQPPIRVAVAGWAVGPMKATTPS